MSYDNFFYDIINHLISENRYREFLDISRIKGRFPIAINNSNGKEIVVWCSNDYLGMGQSDAAIAAAITTTNQTGIGSGGTRNISGTSHQLIILEKEVADLHSKEAALVFSSGYIANDATISALAKIIPDLVIFSDQRNHASIINGIKNSGAQKQIFRHNDIIHLEELLKLYKLEQAKLIIFESIYSMDGDFGEIAKIIDLAAKYQALTYIDEVHGVGLYGKNGGGLAQKFGLDHKIDIIQGTFGKAFGGVGGYIAANKIIIDALRCVASGFIFTTSMPPMLAAGIAANISHLRNSDSERQNHQKKVRQLKALLKDAGIKIIDNQSHIIAIIIGDAALCREVSKRLLSEYNIYIQHINYPTVARGQERLRIIPTPFHSDEMIMELVAALKEILK